MALNTFIMKKNKQNMSDPDALRFEAELKKACLNLKTGMSLDTPEATDLPPEIEIAFLDSIERLEAAWKNSKKITVFNKLNRPDFKKSDTLTERALSEELKKVKEILNQGNIYVDTIFTVDDKTLYDFITEELMCYELDDLNIPDMMIGFTYEEFHPNHEHDIKEEVSRFVRDLLKQSDFTFSWAPRLVVNFKELQQFVKAFEEITIHHFNIDRVQVIDEKATATFQIKFTGKIDRSSGSVIFNGPGTASLELHEEFWNIVRLEFPV
jgi:hypothetical protein